MQNKSSYTTHRDHQLNEAGTTIYFCTDTTLTIHKHDVHNVALFYYTRLLSNAI